MFLERLSSGHSETIRRVAAVASDRRVACCLVGGAVRDLLLGVEASSRFKAISGIRAISELDFVIEDDARAFAEAFARWFDPVLRLRVHERFLTASVVLPDGGEVDFARARRERYARPGALPEVEPAPIDADFRRRDFTINALMLSLNRNRFGELIDPCGGRLDLERGVLSVLHDGSFRDDPTRIFRGVRFARRLGFAFESNTSTLAREALDAGALESLSATRLRNEVVLLLGEAGYLASARALEECDGLELLSRIDPALAPDPGARERLGALDARTGLSEHADRSASPGRSGNAELSLFLAAFGACSYPASRNAVADRFGFAGGPRRAFVRLSEEARALAAALSREGIERSAIASSIVAAERKDALITQLAAALEPAAAVAVDLYRRELDAGIDPGGGNGPASPWPALKGEDLKDLGIPEGPLLGRILRHLTAGRLDRWISTREEAVAEALKFAKEDAARAAEAASQDASEAPAAGEKTEPGVNLDRGDATGKTPRP